MQQYSRLKVYRFSLSILNLFNFSDFNWLSPCDSKAKVEYLSRRLFFNLICGCFELKRLDFSIFIMTSYQYIDLNKGKMSWN